MNERSRFDCQIDYWNTTGSTKVFSHPVNIARLRQLLGLESAILDFGCGYGRVLGLLKSHGYHHLRGVDPAPAMIAGARARFPETAFDVLMDSPRVAVPDASFDAILLFSVLTCVPTDDGQRAIVQEAARILRPGGLLYVSDLWLQPDARNRDRYDAGVRRHDVYGVFDLPEGVTLRHHDRAWIDTLTEGYDLTALDDLEITTMNGHSASGFQWFGRVKSRRTVPATRSRELNVTKDPRTTDDQGRRTDQEPRPKD